MRGTYGAGGCYNPDGIMLMYADSGHCGSRAMMAPGAMGDEPARVCGRPCRAQSLDRFPFIGREGAQRPGGDNPAEG